MLIKFYPQFHQIPSVCKYVNIFIYGKFQCQCLRMKISEALKVQVGLPSKYLIKIKIFKIIDLWVKTGVFNG